MNDAYISDEVKNMTNKQEAIYYYLKEYNKIKTALPLEEVYKISNIPNDFDYLTEKFDISFYELEEVWKLFRIFQ